jgi:hypothetical protein|tara:strand:- start:94 stop:660 length:567 start_codon:yes stop_codon:yes gene_type:complete
MNFRFAELVETKEFQYVRIHKNGNKSVMNCILDTYKDNIQYTFGLSKKPRFCIIRDPYERFLSGLKYDLLMNNVDIKDVNIKKLFTSNENHLRNTLNGRINHSASQIPYIINYQIDYYVDIDDLNLFLKMHFNKTKHLEVFPKDSKYNDIEKHIDKTEVMKYLHFDYYVYNHIKNSPFLWDWQHGKIF